MANPKLIVEVAGDSRKLTRTLRETETSTKRWARRMQGVTSATGTGGGLLSLGRAGGFAAAGGAAFIALKKINDAARESQVVLGQTSVAVDNAGLSWNEYGRQVEDAATSISRASSFDDEDVLKAFSTFVRGNKNVAKSIDLAALAADVARGRYTDLETATQLVNKAAMGQVGALRRAGIQIDKNATSTEALALLQEKFAGSAEKYSKSSGGAADRLRVSWENLLEDLGSNTSNQVGQTQSSLASLVDSLDRVVRKNEEVQQSWQRQVSGMKDAVRDYTAGAKAFDQAFGLGAFIPQPPRLAPAFGQPGFKPGQPQAVPATAEQRNQWFDSDITRRLDKTQDIATIRGQISSLQQIAGLIQQRIAVTKDITRKLGLEDQLRFVRRQESSLGDQLRRDAEDAKEAAKAAKERLKAAQEEAASTRLAQRTARQFRQLGLAPDGSEVTPGVASLKKRVAQIKARVEDTKFDTPKLQTQLARFRKVLAEGLVPKDVRSKIQSMLDEINQTIGQNAKPSGPLTKATQLSADRILAGFKFSRADERLLRARLSHFNSTGTALTGSGSGSQTINVNSTVVVDGKVLAKSTSKQQARTRKVNTSQRNGPLAGRRAF